MSDISVQTLALGAQHAEVQGLDAEKVHRLATDFHDLPFPDGAFDVIYIASALHHTLRWQVVLKELQRATAPGRLLILQNEPCRRSFCLNKFPTNREATFRPVETELQQQGIIRTVAETYLGSRPEALFGMIENQTMRLPEMLALLRTEGSVEHVRLDPTACIAEFEQMLLAAPRDQQSLAATIEARLITRMEKAQDLLTTIDVAIDQAEVAAMARDTAQLICELPALGSENYEMAKANLLGSALSVVMRKVGVAVPKSEPVRLRYANGGRVGVTIGYPPALSKLLELAHDLAPDIQLASPDEPAACFSAVEWTPHRNAIHRELLALVLVQTTGNIKLRKIPTANGMLLVLIRVYGHPIDGPLSIHLVSNQVEYARVDVYQPDSFLLRGEVPMRDE